MTDDSDPLHEPGKRRRPFWVWAAAFMWLIALLILLEYTLSSFAEYEPQAGVLAGALGFGLLLAGLIIILVRSTAGYTTQTPLARPNRPTSTSPQTQSKEEHHDG
ncbi:MAG: hypothetical protein KC547_23555 [Anaerolineae bacterium]|nr:hypothetical protein [Anaerolineae bacterium]